MEYDPEIVVDELTFFFTWFIGGIMTKPYTIVIPIYEQVTSMSGDGIKVFSTVQPWFKCFFSPRKDRGSNITSFAGRHVLHNGKANTYALQYFNMGGRSPICL
jgi:hypothetical protein